MNRKVLALIFTLIFILILTVIGVLFTYIVKVTNIEEEVRSFLERKEVTSYAKVTTLVSSPTSELDKIQDSITVLDVNKNKLTSSVLKLSFTYNTKVNGESVKNIKAGNRITLTTNSESSKVQYIELFTKNADESLAQAVKRIFLKGVPESICLYKDLSTKYNFNNSSFKFGSINPGNNATAAQCPTPFTVGSAAGDSFFIYNPKFPDRFGFIYLDSPFIEGAFENSYWFESLEFLSE